MVNSISVITINRNNASGLKRTLESVAFQSFKNFELIVVDGDSTDESKFIVSEYTSIVSIFISEPDSGIYNAMNKGIAISNNYYLYFLNSGDEFASPNVLENINQILSKSPRDLIAGNVNTISERGEMSLWYNMDKFSFSAVATGHVPHQGFFFNKELFDNFGCYREDLKIVSDWAFILDMINHGVSILKTDIVFCNFYLDGISNNRNLIELQKREREIVLNNQYKYHLDDLEIILKSKRIKSLVKMWFSNWINMRILKKRL